MDNQVQTRSGTNGLQFFESVKNAYEAYLNDKSIWKISFEDEDGKHRWVKKKKSEDDGKFVDEKTLCNLSEDYANCTNDDETIFWYDQYLDPIVDEVTFKVVEFPIKAVLTDEQFKSKYCS